MTHRHTTDNISVAITASATHDIRETPGHIQRREAPRGHHRLWAERWRHREAVGNVIIVRYADDRAPRRRKEEATM